jgi:hypothetical protein
VEEEQGINFLNNSSRLDGNELTPDSKELETQPPASYDSDMTIDGSGNIVGFQKDIIGIGNIYFPMVNYEQI